MSQTQIPSHAAVPVTWQCEQCAGRGVGCGACKGKGSVTVFVGLPALVAYLQDGLVARVLDTESEAGQ